MNILFKSNSVTKYFPKARVSMQKEGSREDANYLISKNTVTDKNMKNKEHRCQHYTVNPFVPIAPFLYPLKTSENRKVFWCFQGVEKGCIGNEWVNFGGTRNYIQDEKLSLLQSVIASITPGEVTGLKLFSKVKKLEGH